MVVETKSATDLAKDLACLVGDIRRWVREARRMRRSRKRALLAPMLGPGTATPTS